ncbi:MAG: MarR family transcriptional regulator [Lachnospiraceae bacterium]|nr:MarR family transcriptional regulator [Lachnospiraceae bacterium]
MKRAEQRLKHFNFLTSEINSVYHEAALKFGLSDSAMMVLYAVCDHDGSCLLNEIGRLSGTSKQTVHSAVRRLEEEGYVRLDAFDGRKKVVRLTEGGEELMKRTALQLIRIEEEIWDSWTQEECELYLSLTQRYLDCFRSKVAGISKQEKD